MSITNTGYRHPVQHLEIIHLKTFTEYNLKVLPGQGNYQVIYIFAYIRYIYTHVQRNVYFCMFIHMCIYTYIYMDA